MTVPYGNLPHPAYVCSGPQLDAVIADLESGALPRPDAPVWREDLPLQQAIALALATGCGDAELRALLNDRPVQAGTERDGQAGGDGLTVP